MARAVRSSTAPNGPRPAWVHSTATVEKTIAKSTTDGGGEPVAEPGRGDDQPEGDRRLPVGAEEHGRWRPARRRWPATSSASQWRRGSEVSRAAQPLRAWARISAVSMASTEATTTKVLQVLRTSHAAAVPQVRLPGGRRRRRGARTARWRRAAARQATPERARGRACPATRRGSLPQKESHSTSELAKRTVRPTRQVGQREQHGRAERDVHQRRRRPPWSRAAGRRRGRPGRASVPAASTARRCPRPARRRPGRSRSPTAGRTPRRRRRRPGRQRTCARRE